MASEKFESTWWGWSDGPDLIPDSYKSSIYRANLDEVIRLAETAQFNDMHTLNRTVVRAPHEIAFEAMWLGGVFSRLLTVDEGVWRSQLAVYDDNVTTLGRALPRYLVRIAGEPPRVVKSTEV